MAQEIKGRSSAKWVKAICGLLFILSIFVMFLNPRLGLILFVIGLFGFVAGRFME